MRPWPALATFVALSNAACLPFDAALLQPSDRDGGDRPSGCQVELERGAIVREEPPIPDPPVLGAGIVDPTWGTCVRRVSSLEDGERPSFRHRYPLNADATTLLLALDDYQWTTLDVRTGNVRRPLAIYLESDDARWDPTNPNLFRYSTGNDRFTLQEHDLELDRIREQLDFTDAVRAIFPDATALRAPGSVLGRTVSDDQRFWAFRVLSGGSAIGNVILDVATQNVTAFDAGGLDPERIALAISRTGEHLIAMDCDGETRVHRRDDHSVVHTIDTFDGSCPVDWDFAWSADGAEEVFVWSTTDAVRAHSLVSGTELLLVSGLRRDADQQYALVAGASRAKPGWIVLSFFECTHDYGGSRCETGFFPSQDRMVVMDLANESRAQILNLAWHRSRNARTTELTLSPAFDRALFLSSWGASDDTTSDAYEVVIPQL